MTRTVIVRQPLPQRTITINRGLTGRFDSDADYSPAGDWNHLGALQKNGVDVSVAGHGHAISDVSGLQTALDGKVDENAAITGATKTKITYDSKGLVTSGADATTSDIGEGTNLYHTAARVRDVVLTGLSLATSQVIAATDTILQAFGYLQAQITAIGTANSTTVKTALNATGDAPIYAARAWCCFTGTGTASVAGGGNIASGTSAIIDRGVGHYTFGFTTLLGNGTYASCIDFLQSNTIPVTHAASVNYPPSGSSYSAVFYKCDYSANFDPIWASIAIIRSE
jgi:hypothetical protein